MSALLITGDILTVCRVCVECKPQMFSILSSIVVEGQDLAIPQIITALTSQPLEEIHNEDLPPHICTDCIGLLEAAYTFKTKYDKSTKFLKRYLKDLSTGVTEYGNVEGEVPTIKEEKPVTSSESENAIHPCPVCLKKFTAAELKKHALKHKSLRSYIKAAPEIKCKIRFYATPKNEPSLLNQKGPILHNCPFCPATFSADDFKMHIRAHKINSEFKCDMCDRVFSRRNYLNFHRLCHNKDRPYKCKWCGKGFVIKKNYEFHILMHKNLFPFACEYCNKKYSNPQHLQRHMVWHQENRSYFTKFNSHLRGKGQPVQVLKCPECDLRFPKKRLLNRHLREVHDIPKIKKHICEHCGKEFDLKHRLQRHLILHSGEKPFVCSYCGKAFNNISNMMCHEKIHREPQYCCQECGKKFSVKSNLKKHILVHVKQAEL